MVMKNNRTFPQRGRADGGVRQSVLNVTGREAWNKCWINSLNRVFIAVLCHFSVTTQDSNVLFVLKFTRFNKNSRYWMFFPIFFSIWRNIHWFPVRCQRFQHRRFDCVDPNVSPGTYELGRNRICWPRISSTFLYLMYVSFYFFGFVRSSLCSGTNTYHYKPGWFCSWRRATLLSSGPIHTMNIRECKCVLSADCSGDSVAAWTPFKPTLCSLTCTGPINQFKCLISVINPHFWGFSFSQKYRFFLNMFYGRNLVLHNHGGELENFELEESRFLLIVIIG